jgi:hypothetical protein
MDKSSFKPDTRYVLTLKDVRGTPRPANLYVYRVYDQFMIARSTSGDGLVRKVKYEDVLSIVEERAVASAERYFLPAAILDEKTWRDRDSMQHYASAPGRGK